MSVALQICHYQRSRPELIMLLEPICSYHKGTKQASCVLQRRHNGDKGVPFAATIDGCPQPVTVILSMFSFPAQDRPPNFTCNTGDTNTIHNVSQPFSDFLLSSKYSNLITNVSYFPRTGTPQVRGYNREFCCIKIQ